ncbi:MAG: alpha/beta hydrolase [Actinobacteria bacterium]|nr:alpha/beta hydrolase [Actinomycetota bacterium]
MSIQNAMTEASHSETVLVILIHGQPGTAKDFDDIIARMPRNVRIEAYDRPGWGESPLRATTLANNARLLMSFAHSKNFSKLILVGYSYGAAVAVRSAIDFPNQIAAMVLIAPVGGVSSISLMDHFLAKAGSVIRKISLYSHWPANVQMRTRPLVSFQIEQELLHHDLTQMSNQIETVEIPTIMVVGADDFFNPLGGTLALHEMLRNSRMRLIPGAGHMVLIQSPETVVAEIYNVWSEINERR